MARISATEAARSFSEVLTRAADGERIEVTRGGEPVATIMRPSGRLISAARFRELLATAPGPDDDFLEDLREIRLSASAPPSTWPS